MMVLKESYFDNFKCTADKCKDTCCAGWIITIDKDTYKKYKNISGKFGIKLKNNIEEYNSKSFATYGKIKLDNEKHCPFLDDNNLCEVYKNLSPKDMCLTCKVYPRRYRYINDIFEKELVLSCPEVARMFIQKKDKMDFVMEGEYELDDVEEHVVHKEIAKGDYNFLFDVRSFAIEIMQYSIIPIWKRFYFLLNFLEKAQHQLDLKNYNEINNIINKIRIEITDKEISDELDSLPKISSVKLKYISDYTKIKFDNDLFHKFTEYYNDFVNKNKNIEEAWMCKEDEFEKKFYSKEIILENYLVHQIYVNFMKDSKINYNEEITKIIFNYTIFKAILILNCINNNYVISDEKLACILYKYCRETGENNLELEKSIYNSLAKANYNEKVYLLSLVR